MVSLYSFFINRKRKQDSSCRPSMLARRLTSFLRSSLTEGPFLWPWPAAASASRKTCKNHHLQPQKMVTLWGDQDASLVATHVASGGGGGGENNPCALVRQTLGTGGVYYDCHCCPSPGVASEPAVQIRAQVGITDTSGRAFKPGPEGCEANPPRRSRALQPAQMGMSSAGRK